MRLLAKKRMRKTTRALIDDRFRCAHSVHSIVLEELRNVIKSNEAKYNELMSSIKHTNDNIGY